MSAAAHFRKSWGAEPAGAGWRFRLWAPSQERVSLRIGDGPDLPMEGDAEGWFSVATGRVAADGAYSFVLGDGTAVPDPAARGQTGDVHGPSRLVDPRAFAWRNADWTGRPWEETILYELHTGTFSPEGTFDGIRRRLDHLVDLGVTAVELLPVAQFAGDRGWGYDGVLLYAPHRAYGGPEGLKRLVDEAHGRGLMVFLDVVYNHFGPDGNYLHLYAPDFFHPERHTPWGAAIAYEKAPVRSFFVENALYWLEEYRLDGLRLDAVNEIADQSEEPLLEELGAAVRSRIAGRHVHLTTEDDRNITSLHRRDGDGRPILYSGEWNDDFHHAAHVLATGEHDGYYGDYFDDPVGDLARALSEGYVYQGEASHYWGGKPRGEPSGLLPPAAFVDFLQNHDQTGNRALGERLGMLARPGLVELLTAMLLLGPQVPLLFMGEEWDAETPFWFFTDFHGELGAAVREGRRREFAAWSGFASEEMRERIADPNAAATFEASRLDWSELDDPRHRARLDFVRALLALRRREIVPLIPRIGGDAGSAERLGPQAIQVSWRCGDGAALILLADLGDSGEYAVVPAEARILFATPGAEPVLRTEGRIAGRSVVVLLDPGPEGR